MASVATPFCTWFDPPSLFQPPSKLLIESTSLTQIRKSQAVHPRQRCIKKWTVKSNELKALTKLRLVTPGLTIVRVNPTILARFGSDMVARIRVTSDDTRHIDCVSVASKKRHELRVVFKNATSGENESDMGSLVTEIDLAHASQITEILAMGGGDVTVHGGVLVSDIDHGVMLAAIHETKLNIDESRNKHLQLKDLLIGSACGGEVYISSKNLMVLETFACGVLGEGRIHVVAPRLSAKTTQLAAVGDHSTIQVKTTDGLATSDLSAVVVGSGYTVVQSSSTVETGRFTTCAKLDIKIEGTGRLDVAGVPSERTRVKIRDNGRVTIQPRHKLDLDCAANAVVECVGALPQTINTSGELKKTSIVQTSHHERMVQQRVGRATAPIALIPSTPTVAMAFDSKQWLHVTKAGFRDTFLRPIFELQ